MIEKDIELNFYKLNHKISKLSSKKAKQTFNGSITLSNICDGFELELSYYLIKYIKNNVVYKEILVCVTK